LISLWLSLKIVITKELAGGLEFAGFPVDGFASVKGDRCSKDFSMPVWLVRDLWPRSEYESIVRFSPIITGKASGGFLCLESDVYETTYIGGP
jgi:hypothetical protein